MVLPRHLHRARELFDNIYDRHVRSTFAQLPLDILRWILAPMLLHPYRIIFSDGEDFMLGLGDERFIGRENIVCNDELRCEMDEHPTIDADSFYTTGYGWIVGHRGEARMIGRHGRFTSITGKVGHMVGRSTLTFAMCRGHIIQIRQIGHREEFNVAAPKHLNFRSEDIPEKYNRVVAYQPGRYGYVHIVLWDGDRGLFGRAYDDPSYEDEFWEGNIIRSWERRLPHRPACIAESYNDDLCEVVYPWGESEHISIKFDYVDM